MKKIIAVILSTLLLFSLAGCSQKKDAGAQQKEKPVLKIGGIPDQNAADMKKGFDDFAKYLGEKTGLKVEYVPAADYAAIVTAFERGDVQLVWFGGLTGVQAASTVPAAEAIAQRPRDEQFHSVFITQKTSNIEKLADLKGKTFTFGSESSTSGHLMPRYFLLEAGIDPSKDFNGKPNFSGSHDKTYKMIESGAYQAGALNEAVWEGAVKDKKVDVNKVKVFYKTPAFYDYHWVVNNLDEKFGKGTKDKVKQAILSIDKDSPKNEILKLLQTEKFIETKNSNYDAIRKVAKQIGIIK